MEFLLAIIGVLLGIVAISLAVDHVFGLRFSKMLRRMSTQEIERLAFGYEEPYFSLLGQGHESVTRFREMIEARDLPAIRANWAHLSRSFRKLERLAGHSGRPLILDYYCYYTLVLREMARRQNVGNVI